MMHSGCFDKCVIDSRRRFTGFPVPGGAIKLKCAVEDLYAVVISDDKDLASCLEHIRTPITTITAL